MDLCLKEVLHDYSCHGAYSPKNQLLNPLINLTIHMINMTPGCSHTININMWERLEMKLYSIFVSPELEKKKKFLKGKVIDLRPTLTTLEKTMP